MIVTLLAVSLFAQGGRAKPTKIENPIDIFHELDGKWRGTFVGYDASGKTLYRIQVEQIYKTVNGTTQSVRVRDQMADGKVITGIGTNTATRGKDGALRLRCVVKKSTGERVVHDGRISRGPGGRQEVIWFSKSKDRVETFREWVTGKGESAVYHIHGMGRYGKTMMLMAGEYRRVK